MGKGGKCRRVSVDLWTSMVRGLEKAERRGAYVAEKKEGSVADSKKMFVFLGIVEYVWNMLEAVRSDVFPSRDGTR